MSGRERLTLGIVFPTAAALAGAAIGAVVTVLISAQQIAAADRAALREQRHTTYAGLIVSADECLRAIDQYASIVGEPLPADRAQLEETEQRFEQQVVLTLLVSSDIVRERTMALSAAVGEARRDVVDDASNETGEGGFSNRDVAAGAVLSLTEAASAEIT